MPIIKITKNYLYNYIMTLYLANKNRPDPQTCDPTKPVILMGGGSRCFEKYTLVYTDSGSKHICNIDKNDKVLSYNHKTEKCEFKNVVSVFKNENNTKKCYCFKFKNGDKIKCTEDHEIFYQGRYVCAKDLVSLHKQIK